MSGIYEKNRSKIRERKLKEYISEMVDSEMTWVKKVLYTSFRFLCEERMVEKAKNIETHVLLQGTDSSSWKTWDDPDCVEATKKSLWKDVSKILHGEMPQESDYADAANKIMILWWHKTMKRTILEEGGDETERTQTDSRETEGREEPAKETEGGTPHPA